MEATSIGDWFKAASPAAKVIAIGSDAAIPYGGKRPDGTYWFDSGAGGFTTSTYYAAARPAWIDALNARIAQLPKTWTLAVPERWRALANHPQQCPAFKSDGDAPVTGARDARTACLSRFERELSVVGRVDSARGRRTACATPATSFAPKPWGRTTCPTI